MKMGFESLNPVSAAPVGAYVRVSSGHVFELNDGWYYQESDRKPMEYLCPLDGHPRTGDFFRRDGRWYYQRNEDAPLEDLGPVDGRAVII